jgi:hypothetical protein
MKVINNLKLCNEKFVIDEQERWFSNSNYVWQNGWVELPTS